MFSLRLAAQNTDSLLLPHNETLTESDSLSIFYLIDSLLTLEELNASSQLAFRFSYNSNVLWAGRTLGIDNFGLAPGVSYYHKSGLFTDVSTYWSKDFEPNFYLTTFSVGYMHTFSSRFSFITSYDHYFYNLAENYIPYSNAFTISPFLDFKPVTLRVDYYYYFGKESTHRVMPSISLSLQKKNFLNLDKVSVIPSVYMLLGNETITEIILPSTREEWIAALLRLRKGQPWYIINSENVFGIMNYSLMMPLYIKYKDWNFSLTYTYNIPKALPGETLVISNSSFLSASVAYFLDLKSNKSPF